MVLKGFLDGKMLVCNVTGMVLWSVFWIQDPEGTDNLNIQTCRDSYVLDFHLSTAAPLIPGTSLFVWLTWILWQVRLPGESVKTEGISCQWGLDWHTYWENNLVVPIKMKKKGKFKMTNYLEIKEKKDTLYQKLWIMVRAVCWATFIVFKRY